MTRAAFIFLLSACILGCGNKRSVIKKVHVNGVNILWFRESYLDNTRAFITLEDDKHIDTLVSCEEPIITDFLIVKDTVTIKMYDLKNAPIYHKTNHCKNYTIILKNATYEEWHKHYHPKERFYPVKGL